MKKKISIYTIIILLILLLSSCANKKQMYSRYYMYFGTEIYIEIYSDSENKANQYLEYANTFLKEYSDLSDRYYLYEGITNIKKINYNAGETLSIDKRLFDLIEYGIENGSKILNENNKPYFTIGIGKISDIYKDLLIDDYIDNLPTEELGKEYNTDVNAISLNKDSLEIILPSDMSLDLGGYAKGYTVELLSNYFESENISYTINAGASTIITNIGNPKRKNNSYFVGLVNPDRLTNDEANSIYGIIDIPFNKAITTSGDYQSYFIYNGKLYSHIIDPYTNYSCDTDIRSITIITDSNAYGDILSTTLYMMGSTKAVKYAKEHNDIDIIMFLKDSSIIISEGMKKYATIENNFTIKNQ